MKNKTVYLIHLNMKRKIPVWVETLESFSCKEDSMILHSKMKGWGDYVDTNPIGFDMDRIRFPVTLKPKTMGIIRTFDKDKVEQYKKDIANKFIEIADKRLKTEQEKHTSELERLNQFI